MEKSNKEEWGRTTPGRDRATKNLLLSGLPPSIPRIKRVSDPELGGLPVRGDRIGERLFALLIWISLVFVSGLIWFLIMKTFVDWYIPRTPPARALMTGPMNPSNIKSARDYMEHKKNE